MWWEDALMTAALTRTSFDRSRLGSALADLRANKLLVGFGEGAVQLTLAGREQLRSKRLA